MAAGGERRSLRRDSLAPRRRFARPFGEPQAQKGLRVLEEVSRIPLNVFSHTAWGAAWPLAFLAPLGRGSSPLGRRRLKV